MRALVAAHPRNELVVGVSEGGWDLVGGELVVSGPRLGAAEGAQPAKNQAAVLVAPFVGVDLG